MRGRLDPTDLLIMKLLTCGGPCALNLTTMSARFGFLLPYALTFCPNDISKVMLSERGRQIVGKVRDYENIMIMGEGCGQGCGRIRNCSAQTKDAEGSENDARY